MSNSNEARLVARVAAGDERALEEFISTYRRLILGVLRRQVSLSPEDADEVFQRFLIHVWENDFARLKSWRGTSSLSAYLATIARNLGRDFRRSAALQIITEISDTPMPEDVSKVDQVTALEAAISRLSLRDRELIRRRYYQGQSYREIAEALQITVNGVGVALLRAERRLKSLARV